MFRNVPECSGMFHVPGFIDGLVKYHVLPSLYVLCVWFVSTLTSTAPIGSPTICTRAPADFANNGKGI